MDLVKDAIRDIPDFPKPGIVFKDITPMLHSPAVFEASMRDFVERYLEMSIDVVAGIESRGFIFGAPLALALRKPFVPVRKPGKLPYDTERIEYELEYGTDALEIHTDAVEPGQRVLVVDDLLATGGTVGATIALFERLGARVVEAAFVVELGFLEGREKLGSTSVYSQVIY